MRARTNSFHTACTHILRVCQQPLLSHLLFSPLLHLSLLPRSVSYPTFLWSIGQTNEEGGEFAFGNSTREWLWPQLVGASITASNDNPQAVGQF